jgi:hypothetical protein
MNLPEEPSGIAIRIRVRPGRLSLSASLTSGLVEVGAAYEGPPLQMTLNSSFVLDALRVLEGNKVTISFGPAAGMELASFGSPLRTRCIIALIRI